MKSIPTDYGTVHICNIETLFLETLTLIKRAAITASGPMVVGLTGGSTPKAFYQWAHEHKKGDRIIREKVIWSTSDERHVPLDSEESNFGNADRLLLQGWDIPEENKFPWPVDQSPDECADLFTHQWNERFGAERTFDLCFLGMGDDCHTASLFPECPLIGSGHMESFAAVEWPGRGWRLTLTPEGLHRAHKIIVSVTGAGKQEALKDVFERSFDPHHKPIQLLKAHVDKTIWLIDEAAAEGVRFIPDRA